MKLLQIENRTAKVKLNDAVTPWSADDLIDDIERSYGAKAVAEKMVVGTIMAKADDALEALELEINSPGGSVFASEVVRREVSALRAAGKPVVASMSGLAASGGYYIAMDADRIVASPATLTGSIGIFAMFPTFQRTLERLGVHSDGVGTTALSGEFRGDRALGDASRSMWRAAESNIDDVRREVVAAVEDTTRAIERKMPKP
jgi:protease-4